MSERLRHGGSVGAGLLGTIVHLTTEGGVRILVSAEFQCCSTARLNSKVLNPLLCPQSDLPYFGKQSAHWGQVGCKPGFPS